MRTRVASCLQQQGPDAHACTGAGTEVKDGESMMSEFFNEAYFFVHEKQRWFPVTMRPPKLTKAEERSLDRRGVDVKDLQAGAGSVLVIKRDK